MHTKFPVLAILMALLLWGAAAMAAPTYSIDYVVKNFDKLINTEVTVKGYVENSMVLTPSSPLDKTHGQYDLVDEDGARITVRTPSAPPPLNSVRTVTGSLMVAQDENKQPLNIIMEKPIFDLKLILALVGLGILAIVLLILLLRKPAPATPSIITTSGGGGLIMEAPVQGGYAPPAPPQTIPCPSCGTPNELTANFCESCGTPFRGGAGGSKGTTEVSFTPAAPAAPRGSRPTVMLMEAEPALADLTVIGGDGARYGTKFALSRERTKLGRDETKVQIPLSDETISREHAIIWMQDGEFYIQDDASKAGTIVNGAKVTREMLKDGDTIQLGSTKLKFSYINKPA